MSEENPDLTAMAEPSAQRALEALNQAALAIASELDVDKVLQLIVDSARDLVGAKYAALAVGEFAGEGADIEDAFALDELAGALGGIAGTRSGDPFEDQ